MGNAWAPEGKANAGLQPPRLYPRLVIINFILLPQPPVSKPNHRKVVQNGILLYLFKAKYQRKDEASPIETINLQVAL